MNKKSRISKYIYIILSIAILFTSISGIIVSNAKVNLKDELFLKRSDVYYFNYNKKTKKNIEKLMDEVDKLKGKKVCTKEKVNELWEEFQKTIKTVPKKEMVGFFPDRIAFENAGYKNFKADELTGYDQFAYVYQNLLYYACKYLNDKDMNEFVIQYTDDFYTLCIWQAQKKNTNIELYRVFTLLNNVADKFDNRNKLIITKATNMVSALIQTINNNQKWNEKSLPSELVDAELKAAKENEEKVAQEGKEQIEAEESSLELRKPTISSSNNSNSNSNTSYSDSYNEYFENLRNQYNASENEGGDNGLYNIYYTVNKNDEKPEYIDSKIQVTKDKITYQNICDALKIFASKENFDSYEDSDAFMFIGEGKPLVLNDIEEETVENDIVNHLFDEFETLGLKVALQASEEENELNDSLASKIENNELNEIQINGSKLILTDSPILSNNIVQLPIKQILQELDLELNESEKEYVITKKEDKDNKDNKETDETKTDEENKHEFRFTVGTRKYSINQTDGIFKTEPQIKNGILYVEMDSIAKAFGYEFSYDSKNSCFVIK